LPPVLRRRAEPAMIEPLANENRPRTAPQTDESFSAVISESLVQVGLMCFWLMDDYLLCPLMGRRPLQPDKGCPNGWLGPFWSDLPRGSGSRWSGVEEPPALVEVDKPEDGRPLS
jgi:hypothetical protein